MTFEDSGDVVLNFPKEFGRSELFGGMGVGSFGFVHICVLLLLGLPFTETNESSAGSGGRLLLLNTRSVATKSVKIDAMFKICQIALKVRDFPGF